MEAAHLFGLLPLLVLLILSLVFNKSGLVHLMTLGYTIALGWFAVVNGWEIMFFPILIITGIIAIILFITAMTRGDWL